MSSEIRNRWLGRLTMFFILSVFYLAIPNARPDFTRFNAHDSESYLALSHSLAHGRGYTRSLIDGMYVPHRTWPPGMPLLMVPASLLHPDRISWLAAKTTMIVVGLVGVVLCWLLMRRLSGSETAADVAAAALGFNPFYWDFSHQVMTEVPTIAWTFACLLVADWAFANRRPSYLLAVAVGAACGFGMLIKGNLLGLGLVPVAYLFGRRRMIGSGLQRFGVMLCCAIAFCAPFLTWSARNAHIKPGGLDGIDQVHQIFAQSGPTDPNYRSSGQTIKQAISTLRTYGVYRPAEQLVPFLGLPGALSWPGSGWIALVLTLIIVALCLPAPSRDQYIGLDLVILPMLALCLLFYDGGAARYWVPVSLLSGFLLILRVSARLASRPSGRWRSFVAFAVLTVAAANIGVYVRQHERQPFDTGAPWSQLASLFQTVAGSKLDVSAVLTPNMHAFQLTTAYPAPMLSTDLQPMFDSMVARIDGRFPRAPEGSVAQVTVFPWALVKLPAPMTQAQILGEGDYSFGITVWP